jgi:hypothetical protein
VACMAEMFESSPNVLDKSYSNDRIRFDELECLMTLVAAS